MKTNTQVVHRTIEEIKVQTERALQNPDLSPQQKMMAITDHKSFKFFGRENCKWKFLSEEPSTQSGILGFLDDTTALSLTDEITLRIYSLDRDKLLTTDKKSIRKLVSSRGNKNLPLLFSLFSPSCIIF